MNLKLSVVVLASLLLAASLEIFGCSAPSCAGTSSETSAPAPTTVSTTTTTLPPTTTSSTTTTSTTSTTLSPLDAYRAAMKTWADTYGPGLAQAYTAISGANFTNPTPAQVQAAKDLDTLMGPMVTDLQAIQAPPELAAAHDGFLTSLQKMAGGVHDLAQALEQGKSLLALAAVATVGAAWQQGSADRTTLEQALGFSLSG